MSPPRRRLVVPPPGGGQPRALGERRGRKVSVPSRIKSRHTANPRRLHCEHPFHTDGRAWKFREWHTVGCRQCREDFVYWPQHPARVDVLVGLKRLGCAGSDRDFIDVLQPLVDPGVPHSLQTLKLLHAALARLTYNAR